MSVAQRTIGALLITGVLTVAAAQSDTGLIRVRGTQFVDRQCRPFVYSGWNSWALVEAAIGISSALPQDGSFLNGDSYLDYKLDVAKENGLTVGRVFAHGHHSSVLTLQFQPGSYNEDAWVGLDRLLDAAAQRDLKLILTFSDNWKDVDSRGAYAAWAGLSRRDFYTDETIRQWYKNHMSVMVNRVNSVNGRQYKSDPTIFAWNLMNEPRCDCDPLAFTDDCEKPCADEIQVWIEEMSLFLKTQDPYHMLTVGEEGFYGLESGREDQNPDEEPTTRPVGMELQEVLEMYNVTEDQINWAARSGQDFIRNHAPAAIDYAAAHLWPDNWGGMPVEFQTRWIEAHAEDAAALQKPLTIEEFGKISGENAEEVKSVRDPYFKEVYDTFERLMPLYPMGGIAFWEFDGKIRDSPDRYNVFPEHTTFAEIIVPSTQRIAANVSLASVVEDCIPGDDRSYDAMAVDGTIYVSAGPHLLATDEGEDVSEELLVETASDCLAECEATRGCNSVSFNRNTNACFLKSRDEMADVEIEWNVDGWQSYWQLSAEEP